MQFTQNKLKNEINIIFFPEWSPLKVDKCILSIAYIESSKK